MSTGLEIIRDKIAETEEKIALEEAKLEPSEALLVALNNRLTAQQNTFTEQLKKENILLAQAAGKFAFFFLTQFDVLLTSNS